MTQLAELVPAVGDRLYSVAHPMLPTGGWPVPSRSTPSFQVLRAMISLNPVADAYILPQAE